MAISNACELMPSLSSRTGSAVFECQRARAHAPHRVAESDALRVHGLLKMRRSELDSEQSSPRLFLMGDVGHRAHHSGDVAVAASVASQPVVAVKRMLMIADLAGPRKPDRGCGRFGVTRGARGDPLAGDVVPFGHRRGAFGSGADRHRTYGPSNSMWWHQVGFAGTVVGMAWGSATVPAVVGWCREASEPQCREFTKCEAREMVVPQRVLQPKP